MVLLDAQPLENPTPKRLDSFVLSTAEEGLPDDFWEMLDKMGYDRYGNPLTTHHNWFYMCSSLKHAWHRVSRANEPIIVCPKVALAKAEPERERTAQEEVVAFPFAVLGRVKKQTEPDNSFWEEGEEQVYYVMQAQDFYQLSSNLSFFVLPGGLARAQLDRIVPLHDLNFATSRRSIFFVPVTKSCVVIQGFADNTQYSLPHFKETPKEAEKKKFKCGVAFRHDMTSCKHKLKRRCHQCGAKAHLALGTDCQCGYVYCGKHKFPKEKLEKGEDDAHECDFDFKARAKELLKKRVSADGGGYANNGIPRGGEGI